MVRVILQFTAGLHIQTAIQQAIRIAQKLDQKVSFSFNGVNMEVSPDDDFFERISHYDQTLLTTR